MSRRGRRVEGLGSACLSTSGWGDPLVLRASLESRSQEAEKGDSEFLEMPFESSRELQYTVEALTITNTIAGVPYYKTSIL